MQEFGPVKLFKAYLSISEQSSQPSKATLRSELQASGVSLTDTPHNGRKEVADYKVKSVLKGTEWESKALRYFKIA